MWKLYYEHDTITGAKRADWDVAPVTGVQLLAVKLDMEADGKSRVLWFHDNYGQRVYHDCAFYAWFDCDDRPAGVTPDVILDRWAEMTGRTNARVGNLSLDDLASVGVKCGRSISNEAFDAIKRIAIHDPVIL